jgi:proline dehydrogenase
MDTICSKAKIKNCRIWIDAEQQAIQAGIDRWTINLMRRYNTDGKALVYNTLQAYLKDSRRKLKHQLWLADTEGWTLAVKLVRGAYIGNDRRESIHDTKQDTDDSYNNIVRDLLTGTNFGIPHDKFPKVQLFLAGHNPHSVSAAWDLVQSLSNENRLKVMPDFGQLQGMGDVLGCEILQKCDDLRRSEMRGSHNAVVPKVYKCLTWGSIQECMQYLIRRVVENSGGVDRMRDGLSAYVNELKQRAFKSRR